MAKNRQENEPKGGLKAKKLEIIYLPASQLSKLTGNPRRDKDPKAVERLAKLIKAHGWERIGNSVPPNLMRAIAEHIKVNILER